MISKWRVAAIVKRFPFALTAAHSLWRITRPRFSAGVVGVLFNPLGEVLIVEHVYHRYPQWGLPGGYVERGEDPRVSLAREFREELELSIEVGHVLLAERAEEGSHLDFAYLCRSEGSVGTLSSELLDFQWVSPEHLPTLRRFHRQAILEALALVDIHL